MTIISSLIVVGLGVVSNILSNRLGSDQIIFPNKIRLIKNRSKPLIISRMKKIAKGDREVAFMDTYLNYLLVDNDFFDQLARITSLNVPVRILIMNPQSKIAEQREADLDKSLWKTSEDQLRQIYHFAEQYLLTGKIQIRLFDSSTTFNYFKYDDESIVSFFPSEKPSQIESNLKLWRKNNEFADYTDKYFEDKWDANSTCDLRDYLIASLLFGDRSVDCYIGLKSMTSSEILCIVPVDLSIHNLNFLKNAMQNDIIIQGKFRKKDVALHVIGSLIPDQEKAHSNIQRLSTFDILWSQVLENYENSGLVLRKDLAGLVIFEVEQIVNHLNINRAEQFALSSNPQNDRSFSIITSEQFNFSTDISFLRDYALIVSDYENLHRDEYLYQKNPTIGRYRRFGRFDYFLDTGRLIRSSEQRFVQMHDTNRLQGGIVRTFAQLNDHAWINNFLKELVILDFSLLDPTITNLEKCWEICVHQVRISVDKNNTAGDPTPEGRHSDGHSFLSMHLINGSNYKGGESSIFEMINQYHNGRQEQLAGNNLAHTRLRESLDSIILDDTRVMHEATKIFLDPGAEKGFRDMLLIDFDPKGTAEKLIKYVELIDKSQMTNSN